MLRCDIKVQCLCPGAVKFTELPIAIAEAGQKNAASTGTETTCFAEDTKPRSSVFAVVPLAVLTTTTEITTCPLKTGKIQAVTRVPFSALSHVHVAVTFQHKLSSDVAHRPAATSDLPGFSKARMMKTALLHAGSTDGKEDL